MLSLFPRDVLDKILDLIESVSEGFSAYSLDYEARSGRPLDATDEEMCKTVRDLVNSERRIQVEEIAQALGISHGSVSTILHDRVGMRKLTAHWVSKSLSDEQMATRASVCSALMKRFRSKDDFLYVPEVGNTAVWQYSSMAVQQYGSTAIQRNGN